MNFVSQTMKSSRQGLRKMKLQSMSLSIKAFKNIKIWQGLQRLELIKMEIDNTTLLEIAKIETLKSLKMKDCKHRHSTKGTKITLIKHFSKALAANCNPKVASELNDLFQKHMSSLKNLKIGIGKVESTLQQINTTFLDNLILCENLETVSVCLSGFCNSDIWKIFQLKTLRKLILSGWYSLPREFRKNLATNDLLANLEEFEASCNIFRTSDPQLIFQLPKLKSLKLGVNKE